MEADPPFDAAQSRHVVVEENEIELAGADLLQGVDAVIGLRDLEHLDERGAHLGSEGHRCAQSGVELEQFPNGHSNLTYLLRTGGREYVLRRPPLGPVAPKAHDMVREYHVLHAVHPHYPQAPRV